jgi:hypothetical protein
MLSAIPFKFFLQQKLWYMDSMKQTRLVPKWTKFHINPTRGKKMKVSLAAQIFSHSSAAALRTYIEFGHLPPEAESTALFLEVQSLLRRSIH